VARASVRNISVDGFRLVDYQDLRLAADARLAGV
jgi:hypothetical protein